MIHLYIQSPDPLQGPGHTCATRPRHVHHLPGQEHTAVCRPQDVLRPRALRQDHGV